MPIEYEMKYLKEMTEDAISQYSQDTLSAGWFSDVEYKVLQMIQDHSENVQQHFREYQICAMKELIKRGYWVKWRDDISEAKCYTILYRLPQHKEGAD
jgi:hypothetical protein